MAERNKALYSEVRIYAAQSVSLCVILMLLSDFICCLQRLYKASFEKNRANFNYTANTPFFRAAKHASFLINNVSPLIHSAITVIEKLIYVKQNNAIISLLNLFVRFID